MKKLLTFLFSSIILSSCSTMYVPNGFNAPLLRNEGDLSGTISTGINMADIHLAYSPIKNLGFMVSASHISDSTTLNINANKYFRYSGDFGIGTYFINKKLVVTEIYGGIGLAKFKTNNTFSQVPGSIVGNYNRLFVKSTIGSNSKYTKISISVRLSQLLYYKVIDEVNNNVFSSNVTMLEWGGNVAIGSDKAKIILQGGYAFPILSPNFNYGFVPLIMQIGLQLDFRNLVSKRVKE